MYVWADMRLDSFRGRCSCSGAAVRRHLPVAKDGPCAGTKGYRAPEVRILWFIISLTEYYHT